MKSANKKQPQASVVPKEIPIHKCIYDESNPRIEPLREFIDKNGTAEQKRINLKGIVSQKRCEGPHSSSYKGLKQSILKVGLDKPISVIEQPSGYYLVASGNTRLCIYEELAADFPSDPVWKKIPAKIIENTSLKNLEISKIIEHVCKGRDWPAQATASKYYELIRTGKFTIKELSEISGTSEDEIRKQIGAYEDFNKYEKPLRRQQKETGRTDQFSIWVEAQNGTISRAIGKLKYKNMKGSKALAQLVIDEKFTAAGHIRKLDEIVENGKALKALYQQGSNEAVKMLENESINSMSLTQLIGTMQQQFIRWYQQNRRLSRQHISRTHEMICLRSAIKSLNALIK